MISEELFLALTKRIEKTMGVELQQVSLNAVSGGDTHRAYRLDSDKQSIFLKVNQRANSHLLASEYKSLCAFHSSVVGNLYPTPYFNFEFGEIAVMGISLLSIGSLDCQNAEKSAQGLIKQHQITGRAFGWESSNFIGASVQSNEWSESWPHFFSHQRLLPQCEWAKKRGLAPDLGKKIKSITDRLDDLLISQKSAPCLLHGDLWSGNLGYQTDRDQIALVDPAPYYGDPEADIAMTKLFASLPDEFYQQYRGHFKAPDKEQAVHAIYNLYHALNHFNLFGASYEGLIRALLQRIK